MSGLSLSPQDAPTESSPPADVSILTRLELLEDAITFEVHHPVHGDTVLTLGFREHNPHRYRLTAIGYDLAVDEGDVPMFSFTDQREDGARITWYVWTESPIQTARTINAHIKAIKARVDAENEPKA